MKSKLIYGICGASGKMGQQISDVLRKEKKEYVAISDKKKIDNYKNIISYDSKSIKKIACIIDFTSASGFEKSLHLALANGIPFVSGSTGLSNQSHLKMKKASEKIPILWAPNMSYGIALLNKFISTLNIKSQFDFFIEEYHHRMKKDNPSGTALFLKKNIENKIKQKIPDVMSVRAGGLIGVHKIHMVSDSEHLIFEHQALDRKVFAEGASIAANWIINKKPEIYTIQDMLNDRSK